MRCLLVTSVFPPLLGGSATVYASLGAQAAGQIVVLAPRVDYTSGQIFAHASAFDAGFPARVYRLPLLRTRLSQRRDLIWRGATAVAELALRARLLLKISQIARVEGITTLCIGDLLSLGWLAAAGRRLLGLRTIIYVHGEEITMRDNYDPDRTRRRAALAACERVVAVSRFCRSALVDEMGVDQAKITVIPNGVDTSKFTPGPPDAALRARYGLAGRMVLLSVCRLTARKGIDQVIECLPALRAAFPNLAYLIVGEGEQMGELRARAHELGVGDLVVWAGAVDDSVLAAHYRLADVFIMPNRTLANGDTEGFGIVFLEASACGVPVIGGCAGGTADAVSQGINGLLVDGTDRAAITKVTLQLLGDAALRAALGKGGTRVASEAGWSSRTALFLAACEPDDLLGSP